MMSAEEPDNHDSDHFVFMGTKPEYVQGRFINIHTYFTERKFALREFEAIPNFESTTISRKYMVVKYCHYFSMPSDFEIGRMMGQMTCIGCVGDIFIAQYVTSDKHARFVKFVVIDRRSKQVTAFEDTHHFFHRDSATVSPLECLLSPDKMVCLLRLPQSILSPKKWSKLLICKKTQEQEPVGHQNPIIGTSPSSFRDRKFQLMSFDPQHPSKLLTVLLDSYCSKCKFSMHDFHVRKDVLQCSRKLYLTKQEKETGSDSDSEDEELRYFFLQDCSMTYCRSGDTILISCTVIDNMSNKFLNVYFFNSTTLKLVGSEEFSLSSFQLKKHEMLVPVFSVCDSKVTFWLMEREQAEFTQLFTCNVPKPINLKSFCRSVINQAIARNMYSQSTLPLPPSLIKYVHFSQIE